MMSPPLIRFDDARLKIQRARRHILETQNFIRTFAESGICKVVVDENTQAGKCEIRVDLLKEMPPWIATPIGDAVHNLRTALDYVTTCIVGKEDNRITFPMHEERDDLAKSRPFRDVVKALPQLESILLDEVKPYKAGNYSLWAVGKIDNFDKHKLLIPNYSVTGLIGFGIKNRDNTFSMSNENVFFGPGRSRVNLVSFENNTIHGPFEITSQGNPIINVVFAEGSYFDGFAVVPTLVQLLQTVEHTVGILERAYFGSTIA